MLRQGNRYFMLVIVRLISALIFGGIYSVGAQAQSVPLPKFYGVYALYNGKLTELKRNPQSDNYQITIGGQDIIQSLSNITFPDSRNLKFIIFSPQVANMTETEFWVLVMATIRNSPPPSFHIQRHKGYKFRVAPIPNQPQMVQLIREEGTAGGHLALLFNNGLYDYEITQQPPVPQDSCVERFVSYMGPSYQPCRSQADVTTPTPATPASPDWYDVDIGGCRLFVSKLGYLKNPRGKRTWSGACENGYAQGLGIQRTYDPSGRLIYIAQTEMTRGRSRSIAGEYYFFNKDDRLVKVKDGGRVLVTPSNVADWAREILASP